MKAFVERNPLARGFKDLSVSWRWRVQRSSDDIRNQVFLDLARSARAKQPKDPRSDQRPDFICFSARLLIENGHTNISPMDVAEYAQTQKLDLTSLQPRTPHQTPDFKTQEITSFMNATRPASLSMTSVRGIWLLRFGFNVDQFLREVSVDRDFLYPEFSST